MHWMDILAIIIIAWFTVKDYHNGLVMSLFRLAGLIAGVILAGNFGVPLGEAIFARFGWNPTVNMVLGYVIVFLIVVVIAQAIAAMIRSAMNLIMLGWIDKLGGIALGLLKSVLILSIIFWIISILPNYKWVPVMERQSKTYVILEDVVPIIQKTLVDPFIDEKKIKKALKKNVSSFTGTSQELQEFLENLGTFDFQQQQFLINNFNSLKPDERKDVMKMLQKGGSDMRTALERLNLGI